MKPIDFVSSSKTGCHRTTLSSSEVQSGGRRIWTRISFDEGSDQMFFAASRKTKDKNRIVFLIHPLDGKEREASLDLPLPNAGDWRMDVFHSDKKVKSEVLRTRRTHVNRSFVSFKIRVGHETKIVFHQDWKFMPRSFLLTVALALATRQCPQIFQPLALPDLLLERVLLKYKDHGKYHRILTSVGVTRK